MVVFLLTQAQCSLINVIMYNYLLSLSSQWAPEIIFCELNAFKFNIFSYYFLIKKPDI